MDQAKRRRLNEDAENENHIGDVDEENDEGTVDVMLNLDDEELDSTIRFQRIENIIIEAHNTWEVLNDHSRIKLMSDIVDCFLKEQVLMKNSDIRHCAKRISSIFEFEGMDIYYTETDGKASGKLYHFYHNKLKYLRARNQVPPSTRTNKKILKSNEQKDYMINDTEKESIEFLLRETNEPFLEIVDHWRKTFDYRQNLFKKNNKIWDVLSQWKFLQGPFAHVLICEDFKAMHGLEKGSSLRLNWNTFFNAEKIDIIKKKVKDVPTLRTVKQLPASNEYMGISLIYYINAILCPALRKKKLKPTIKNAQDSVMMEAKSEGEITTKLTTFLKACEADGVEPHPIMFWLQRKGETISFILIFHELRYNFKRFVECLDVCFKMFITFNLDVPFESKQFYHLLNELFYKIEHKKKVSAKVLTLAVDLK